jgi:arylsulfatase
MAMSTTTLRETLPIPDPRHVGLTTYDARDPNTKYPPITALRPPGGAPNVLLGKRRVKPLSIVDLGRRSA